MVLISGITGFIGKKIASLLLHLNYKICGLAYNSSYLHLNGLDVPLYNPNTGPLEKVFVDNNIDHVVNLAVCYGRNNESPSHIYNTNCRLAVDLYLLANHFKCKSFINTGSFFEKQANLTYSSDYTQSKKDAFTYCKRLKLDVPFITMQLEHVYGDGDNSSKLLPHVIQAFLSDSKTINLGYCDLDRDLIYVDDVATAYCTILNNVDNFAGKVVEVGLGEATNLKSVIEEIILKLIKLKPHLCSEIIFSKDSKNQLLSSHADTTFLKKSGWLPKISLDEGLNLLINDFINKY
jgi:nucleoside-diphosphate-sugar epimerase